MLVLTRYKNEVILLELPNGDVVEITVLGVQAKYKSQVKIGINAPQDINIVREELLQ